MNKMAFMLLLTASMFIIGKVYASTEPTPHQTQYIFLDSAMSASYSTVMELPPEVPQSFTNPLFWSVNAKCTIESSEQSTPILAKVKKGTGYINGKELSKAMGSETFVVHNNDLFNITADGGAVVELVNKSSQTIKAHCTI